MTPLNPDEWAVAPLDPYVVLYGGYPLLTADGQPRVFHGKEAAEEAMADTAVNMERAEMARMARWAARAKP